MNDSLEIFIEKIIATSYFQKLKNVVENNDFHNHESVYDHLVKTALIAKKEREGNFIANEEAKKLFIRFMEQDIFGIKQKDACVIIALLHDIGKALYIKEEGKETSINTKTLSGKTYCPGHEYLGSTIVSEVINDLFPAELVVFIARIIKLHDTFGPDYFVNKIDWPLPLLINDVKARAEGFYKETLFNVYCDCFTAKVFQSAIGRIVNVFNDPALYTQRKYFIPK